MTALHDFIKAAASYYGVPVDQLTEGSTLDASRGELEVLLRVALTGEDVAAIAQRMARMALEQRVDERIAVRTTPQDDPNRDAYNALSPADKSRFGSFARFKALGGVLPEPVELPPHVWVPGGELTEQQKAMAVGHGPQGYAMDPSDLTEVQMRDWGPRPC